MLRESAQAPVPVQFAIDGRGRPLGRTQEMERWTGIGAELERRTACGEAVRHVLVSGVGDLDGSGDLSRKDHLFFCTLLRALSVLR